MRLLRAFFFWVSLPLAAIYGCSTGSSNQGSSSGNVNQNLVEFLTPLTLSPDGFFVGEEAQLKAALSLKRDSAFSVSSVSLIRLNGNQEVELGVMSDDGNPASGDFIGNDSIYNALTTLNESSAGFVSVKAKIEFDYQGQSFVHYSEAKTIAVMNRFSDEEWHVILNTPHLAQSYYETLSGSPEEKATEVVRYILSLTGVANAGTSDKGHGAWWVYETGALGGIIFDAHVGGSTHKGGPGRGEEGLEIGVKGLTFSGNENAIQSKKALYLGPYLWDFGESDDYHGAWEKITGVLCPSFVIEEHAR